MEILILMVTNVKQIVKKNLTVLVNVAVVLKKMIVKFAGYLGIQIGILHALIVLVSQMAWQN